MVSCVSSGLSCLSSIVNSTLAHVKHHKGKYLAAVSSLALGALISRGASSPQLNLTQINQNRLDLWCDAYHFGGAQSLAEPLGTTPEQVDAIFLTQIKSGALTQYCQDPLSDIWGNDPTRLEHPFDLSYPEKNVVPDLTLFRGEQLKILNTLESQGLIHLSPYTDSGLKAFAQLTDQDAIVSMISKGHSINRKDQNGISLFMRVLDSNRALKKDFPATVKFLIQQGADLNPKTRPGILSPLARVMTQYNPAEGDQDPANLRLQETIQLLADHGATLKPEDFYSVTRRGKGAHAPIEAVRENTRLLKAFRRVMKLNPVVLERMIAQGFDLKAAIPSQSFSTTLDSKVTEYETRPLYITLLETLGVNDDYFRKTTNPSETQKMITKNLERSAKAIKDQFCSWFWGCSLKEVKVSQGNREISLQAFIKKHDHSPDQTLVEVFAPAFT